ncbi:hypothetical protein TELCIR_14714, partial [Teladorsagia circumcincta]
MRRRPVGGDGMKKHPKKYLKVHDVEAFGKEMLRTFFVEVLIYGNTTEQAYSREQWGYKWYVNTEHVH